LLHPQNTAPYHYGELLFIGVAILCGSKKKSTKERKRQMTLEIVKEPHLEDVRTQVNELKRLMDGNANEIVVTQAWASLAKIKDALSKLCPEHPAILGGMVGGLQDVLGGHKAGTIAPEAT
jgi:hypothetical protein